MKIKQVNNKIVDVFIGIGWENWSRWFLEANKDPVQISGIPVSSLSKKSILKHLHYRKI